MLDGELVPPVTAAGNRSLGGARVILPAALSLLVLGALIAIVLLVRRNSKKSFTLFALNKPAIFLFGISNLPNILFEPPTGPYVVFVH